MSAQRAFGNAATTVSTETAHVRVSGSARTYEVREVLRGMGIRWDPVSHAWHGTLPADQSWRLARELGLRPQIVPAIEGFAPQATPVAVQKPHAGPRGPFRPRIPHVGSRTRAEARVAFPDADQDEDGVDSRRFSLLETMSDLPDDSREADERNAEGRLRALRGRVRAARAEISGHPGADAILRRDWAKAARFYARFGITEGQFRHGVPAIDAADEGATHP